MCLFFKKIKAIVVCFIGHVLIKNECKNIRKKRKGKGLPKRLLGWKRPYQFLVLDHEWVRSWLWNALLVKSVAHLVWPMEGAKGLTICDTLFIRIFSPWNTVCLKIVLSYIGNTFRDFFFYCLRVCGFLSFMCGGFFRVFIRKRLPIISKRPNNGF